MKGWVFRRCVDCGYRKAKPTGRADEDERRPPLAGLKRCPFCETKELRKDGKKPGAIVWAFEVEVDRDPATGKRKRVTRSPFESQATAKAGLHAFIVERQRDATRAVDERAAVTVRGFYEGQWVGRLEGLLPKRATRSTYCDMMRLHVLPRVGDVVLVELSRELVQELVDDLTVRGGQHGTGLSPATVRTAHTALRRMLSDAKRWGYVKRNATRDVDLPPLPRRELADEDVWDRDQMRRFLAEARGERLYALFVVLFTTGMRRGEILGLQWDDVDLDGPVPQLRVVRIVTTDNDGSYVQEDTKSRASKRTMSLGPAAVAALREHREAQRFERRRFERHPGAYDDSADWVFPHELGGHLEPKAVYDRFQKLRRRAGLPPLSIHGARHSFATMALEAGEDIGAVSKRLGHAKVSTTYDRYIHLRRATDADMAARLDRYLEGEG